MWCLHLLQHIWIFDLQLVTKSYKYQETKQADKCAVYLVIQVGNITLACEMYGINTLFKIEDILNRVNKNKHVNIINCKPDLFKNQSAGRTGVLSIIQLAFIFL